jgi:aspartyl protease family protein
MTSRAAPTLLLLAAALLAGAVHAQSVVLSGILGGKALLVVDGGPPKSVAVGQSHRGVKVLAVDAAQAEVEINGARQTLRLGQGPVSAEEAAPAADNQRIVLQAVSNGHFMAQGQINGGSVRFMVDTGASFVALSAAEAQRLGINLKTAQPAMMGTANGATQAWRVKLNSVRVGHVTVHEVDAVVMPAAMPYVLLGNSFLTRFQMTRTNDQLVLERRY